MGSIVSVLLRPGEKLGLAFPTSLSPWLFCCSLGGLKKIIYAVGLGYGACMFSSGVSTWQQAPPSIWSNCGCCLYASYGARLAWFLLRRQSDQKYNQSNHGRDLNDKMEKTPLLAKSMVTSLVAVTQLGTAHSLYPVAFATQFPMVSWAGLALGTAGLVLETIADEQKLAAKRAAPNDPVMNGTYSVVRHPNYLGEILFWTGITLASQTALPSDTTWTSRLVPLLGSTFMIWVMLGAAKRLDRQASEKKYVQNEAYKAYMDTTPSLFPGLH